MSWNDNFKRYDTSNGYGSKQQWKRTFYQKITNDEAEAILATAGDEGPHQILGVSQNASTAEIKKAFRALLMKWHPDKNPEQQDKATEMTKIIIAAYTKLTQ